MTRLAIKCAIWFFSALIAWRGWVLWRCEHETKLRKWREGKPGLECMRCLRFFPFAGEALARSPLAEEIAIGQQIERAAGAAREGVKPNEQDVIVLPKRKREGTHG